MQRLVPVGSPDAQKVATDLEAIKDKVNVAGAADERPTVEELEGAPVEQVTEQGPLTTPGTEAPVLETPAQIELNDKGTVQDEKSNETNSSTKTEETKENK